MIFFFCRSLQSWFFVSDLEAPHVIWPTLQGERQCGFLKCEYRLQGLTRKLAFEVNISTAS